MNHGRPTKLEQIQLQQELRKYFDYGISATLAAEKTQSNIKTVCKYFDEWTNAINELRLEDYIKTEKIERARNISSYDKQIVEGVELLDDVNYEIQKLKNEKKPIARHLFTTKLEIQKFILDVSERKGRLMIVLPPDAVLEKQLEERIKEKFKDELEKISKYRFVSMNENSQRLS